MKLRRQRNPISRGREAKAYSGIPLERVPGSDGMVNIYKSLINAVRTSKPKGIDRLGPKGKDAAAWFILHARRQRHPGKQAEPNPSITVIQTELSKPVLLPLGKSAARQTERMRVREVRGSEGPTVIVGIAATAVTRKRADFELV